MIWFLLFLLATGLVVALVLALRKFERESAAVALAETQALRAEVASLGARIEALEAIAADAPLAPSDHAGFAGDAAGTPSSRDADAVSSARRTGA